MSAFSEKLRKVPPVAVLAVILIATFLYYAPTLNDWFFADDALFLRPSQTTGWTTWIAQAFDYRDARPVPEINQYRPLYALTFRLEYELFGLHAWAYHAVNLAVHLGAVTVLWLVVRRLPMPAWGAHLAALIFALHPTYTEAVAWIANGNTPMAVLFALLSFLLFMKFTDGGASRFVALGASLVSMTAALLYHPVVLPYVAAIVAWYFLVSLRPIEVLSPRRWLPLLPMLLVVVPYVLLQRWVREQDFREQVKYQFGDHMLNIGVDYLGLALHAAPDSRYAPIAVGLMIAVTIITLVPLRGSAPLLGLFAVVWYYTALLPDTVFIFGAFNRLMYAPGAPLAVLLSVACVRVVGALSSEPAGTVMKTARPLVYAALGVAIVLFAALVAPRERAVPPNAGLVEHEAALNEEFIARLRREVPEVPPGGTLYIVNPPAFTVHLGLENILRSFVRLYYGEIDVEPVPLTVPPFLNEQQVRELMGPDDRIFVFRPGDGS